MTLVRQAWWSRLSPTRQGFSLIEASIVLGILSMVLGGIWTAASSINSKKNIMDAVREYGVMAYALENIGPTIGSNSAGVPFGVPGWVLMGVVNDRVVQMGVLPADMVASQTNWIINPWSQPWSGAYGSVVLTTGTLVAQGYTWPPGVGGVPANAAINAFEILFHGLPTDACIQLVILLTGTARDPRMTGVFVNQWITPVTTFPISVNQARVLCNPANNSMFTGNLLAGRNSIDVVYRF